MLPQFVPNAIFIFFDLQDNPVDNISGLFRSLVNCTQEQAFDDRNIKLPDLPNGTPFESISQWLKTVDKQLNRPLLICIDEFERLTTDLPATDQQLRQLMSLFRATIQHRKYIRLLVSGVAPFDELGQFKQLWSDTFINVQTLKIGHLSQKNSINLLCNYIPKDTISVEIAQHIYQRTNGQPCLLQAFGQLIVSDLNQHKQKQAKLKDIHRIEEEVILACKDYISNVINSAPEKAQNILYDLSENKPCTIDRLSRRWLNRRLLINEHDQLSIPVFKRWMREYSEL